MNAEPVAVPADADPAEHCPVERYPVGAAPVRFQPGDFILTVTGGFGGWLIRFGQALRYRPGFARWTHAALIVSETGDLLEAFLPGIEKGHLDHYRDRDYYLVRVDPYVRGPDREQIVAYAHWCRQRGFRYGWLSIISLALRLLTGLRIGFSSDRTVICSSLVAKALERSDIRWTKDASSIMPADLARYFSRRAKPTVVTPTTP